MSLKSRSVWWLLIVGLFSLWLAGCGSETSMPTTTTGTISGVASAGAPIIGTVTIKDSNNTGIEKTVQIAADGKYTIDVYGLTPPFVLRADGIVGQKQYHFYSAATSSDVNGNVNITPLTDLIIANIAGQSPAKYYDNSGYSTLTPAVLKAANAALLVRLQPILSSVGLSGSVDLLQTPFNTDHTGLDAVLDLVKISVNPVTSTATIVNIVNQETVTNNFATQTYTNTFTNSGKTTQAAADIRAIIIQIKQYSNLFATSLPTSTDPRILSLFDSTTFLDKGRDLNTYLSDISVKADMIGMSTNVVINSIDPTAGTAVLEIIPIYKRSGIGQASPKRYIKKNGIWLDQGDGWIARADISAEAKYYPNGSLSNNTPRYETGFYFNIVADQPANINVFSAVITGPGLPISGITLDWLQFGDFYYKFNNDADIASIPENATYTINLYDYGNNLLATYTQSFPTRPPKFSELSSTSFPNFTGQTLASLKNFTGGNIQVTWTLPAGLITDQVWLRLIDSTFSNQATIGKYVGGTDTTTTLTLQPITSTGVSFIPESHMLLIYTKDSYGRWFDIYLF